MSATFETLRVWHDARRLTARIYTLTREAPFSLDYGLRDQIRRACVSVMSNIAEGYERRTAKELAQFLRIARGSIGEVRSQLYVAEDVGYIDAPTARDLRRLATTIARQLAGVMSKSAERSARRTART